MFLPVKSAGVVGDGRRSEYVVALGAVEAVDFMTTRWVRLPCELIEKVSKHIINEIEHISRWGFGLPAGLTVGRPGR